MELSPQHGGPRHLGPLDDTMPCPYPTPERRRQKRKVP